MAVHPVALDEHRGDAPAPRVHPDVAAARIGLAQARRALAGDGAADLRHACRRGAGARAVGEDMAEDDVAIVDQRQRVREHAGILGRKAGDQVGADRDSGARGLEPFDEPHRVGAAVAPLHPPQHHVVARLERQVDMRHHARLLRQQREQRGVDAVGVERREAEAVEAGEGEQRFGQRGEAGAAVVAIAGEIDAGEHDLALAAVERGARGGDDGFDARRPCRPACKHRGAEGAIVRAAGLDAQKGAGVVGAREGGGIGKGRTAFRQAQGERRRNCAVIQIRSCRPRIKSGGSTVLVLGTIALGQPLGIVRHHPRAHIREALRFQFRRASGYHDICARPLAQRASHRLPRLPHRLVGHRAAVEHDRVGRARAQRRRADRFALGEVEPAAEIDDLDTGAGAHPKRAQSVSPSNTRVAAPLITIGSPSAHADDEVAAGRATR